MLELPLVLVEQLLRGRVDVTVQELEAHPEREESLLCAVVEVALESPPLLVAGLDDPRARLPQLDQLGAQLRLQALVFQRKSCCRANRLQQPRLVEQITVVDQHRETIPEIGDPRERSVGTSEFATLLVRPDTTLAAATTQAQASGHPACARAHHVPRQARPDQAPRPDRRHHARACRTRERPNAAAAAESPKKLHQQK